MLPVDDVERAARWYAETLGLEIVHLNRDASGEDPTNYAVLVHGSGELHLVLASEVDRQSGSGMCVIGLEGLDALFARLCASGARILEQVRSQPRGFRDFQVEDPFGTHILVQEREHGGARRDHLGRLIDHVHLVVRDLAASRRFYAAVLQAVGRELTWEGENAFACDELFVSSAAESGSDSTGPHRVHLALQVSDREAVTRFHAAALAAGGRDNGAPGERSYHKGYHAAFALDPDGNNIEAVHHGRGRRSAASVVISIDEGD